MTMFGGYFNKPQSNGLIKHQSGQAVRVSPEQNDGEATVHVPPPAKSQETLPEDQLTSLMNTVRDHAITLKCEQAKVISDWQTGLDLLATRMSTLQPLLTKSLEASAEREQTIARLTSSEAEMSRRLVEAERDLKHYRPIAIQLEDELRVVRAQLLDSNRHVSDLETEYAKAQGTINDLFQKATTAEAARQRVVEENSAYVQQLQEQDAALQSLVRERAQLKSELVSVTSDVERLESESRLLSKKYADECDDHGRARTTLQSVQAQLGQLQKDSQARLKDAEERERRAVETLSAREKQFYDLDVRQSALLSKIDFLTRTNQRQREDLRRHLDHIGNLESSNRQLLDALARNTGGGGEAGQQDAEAQPIAPPKLRAVNNDTP